MSEEVAFLSAIAARPNDQLRRLVYADWLEERGDTRHELIRIESEMAGLPVYADRYLELKPDRDRLRMQLPETWCQKLGYVPAYRPLFTKLPPARSDRWRLASEFIDLWSTKLTSKCGVSQEEIRDCRNRLDGRLPTALVEWHTLAGRRRDLWSNQDHLDEIGSLTLDEKGDLEIRRENQNCEGWYIRGQDLEMDDPPVYCRQNRRKMSPTVTAFALFVLLYENQFRSSPNPSHPSPWGRFEPEQSSGFRLPRGFVKSALPYRYWSSFDVVMWEGPDTIINWFSTGECYVTARTRDAAEKMEAKLDVDVEWF